jgi:hypothetical protein
MAIKFTIVGKIEKGKCMADIAMRNEQNSPSDEMRLVKTLISGSTIKECFVNASYLLDAYERRNEEGYDLLF